MDNPMQHPAVQRAMRELRGDFEAISEHALFPLDEEEATRDLAESIDRQARFALDVRRDSGLIAAYHYESIVDPFDLSFHARIGVAIPLSPDCTEIRYDRPD